VKKKIFFYFFFPLLVKPKNKTKKKRCLNITELVSAVLSSTEFKKKGKDEQHSFPYLRAVVDG